MPSIGGLVAWNMRRLTLRHLHLSPATSKLLSLDHDHGGVHLSQITSEPQCGTAEGYNVNTGSMLTVRRISIQRQT